MSHIVTIKTQVRDEVAVQAACRRLQLAPAEQGEFELFKTRAIGLAVCLPEWTYPAVCVSKPGNCNTTTLKAIGASSGTWINFCKRMLSRTACAHNAPHEMV